MRRAKLAWLLVLGGLFLPPLPAQQKGGTVLPEQYRKWLEQEVVYIITPLERSVFRQLTTDREREVFINAFWKQRDPTPETPRNEFQEEHYRRLAYANQFYGRGAGKPGWMTDRGRIYIILGQPQGVETYDSTMGVNATEIWFYLGDPALGLPTAFNVIFFKRNGAGDYILYSPVDDGPRALIAADMGESAQDDRVIYQQLAQLEPTLAPQVLSLIPSERVLPGTVSLASTRLMAAVLAAPQKKIEDKYAEALLKYKDIIEVDYSANYIASDSCLSVLRHPGGPDLVHYSVEPQRISVENLGGQYAARFELDGRVSDESGRTVFQFVKDVSLTLSGQQLKDLGATSLAVQDLFPLVPGTYRFDLLLKNTLSKAFTSMEETVTVPAPDAPPQLGPVVLGYKLEGAVSPSPDFVPFKTADGQLLVQARKTFSRKDDLQVFVQVLGLTSELRDGGRLKFDVFRQEKLFSTKTIKIVDIGRAPDVLEVFPLKDFPPDYYKVRAALLGPDGVELSAREAAFEISPQPDIRRPLIVAKVVPAGRSEEYDYDLGMQWLSLGRGAAAYEFLAKSYDRNPGDLRYALGFAQAVFSRGEYQKVMDVLLPFGSDKTSDLVPYFLGKASQALGKYDAAVAYYQDYLSRFGMNVEVLNLLGTAHFRKGNTAEALATWKKSLEVNPAQEDIKKLVDGLEKNLR
jgi:GWxTD domain-containing protein